MTTRRDLSKSAQDLIEDWIATASLGDLIGQMSQIDINLLLEDDESGGKRLNMEKAEHFIGSLGVGSVLNVPTPGPWKAQDFRKAAIQIQEVAKEHGRPPVIWGLDSVHGANYIHGASWTPQPLNLAATFNVTASQQAGWIASRDTRAAAINWLFSPLLGLALQPYWSRVYETFGEDPVVVGAMASAMIGGIQSVDPQPDAIPSRAAACGKHFVGYSLPTNGHDRSPSWIPRRHLYQYFVPPWQDAMTAGVLTVMESYTEVDGVPNVANPETTRYLLRQRLGFSGVLVTDYQEILNLHDWHHVAGDAESAVLLALRQGTVDMSMIPWDADGFRGGAMTAVQNQKVPIQRITESARKVMQLKAHLNMFEEALIESDPNLDLIGTDNASTLDMARQSIVLVKNQDSTLPWGSSKGRKVLVTGPTSASLVYQTGGWSGQWQGAPNEEDWFTNGSSVLHALASNPGELDISFACGTNILGGECDDEKSKKGWLEEAEGWVGLGAHNSVERAAQAAADADLVVVCVGEESYTEKPGDLRSLRLPDGQQELVRTLRKGTDAKIVLVYFGGRPRLLGPMVDKSDAILIGMLPGPQGGEAVADILIGNVNPSGRLPMTYPAHDDAAGSPYFHAVSDQCTSGTGVMPHYDYTPCEVQWPFGHGLSYTTFDYSNLVVSGDAGGDVQISFEVRNSGDVAGSEAVLIFTFDEYRSTTPEYKRLRRFEKVFLESQTSQSFTLTLSQDDLAFVGPDDDSHFITDPSKPFWVGIGASTDCRVHADDPRCAKVEASTKSVHEPSCLAACSLWQDSGCFKTVGFTSDSCLAMCEEANDFLLAYSVVGGKGWGWNYVSCLELIVWGMRGLDQVHCERMTSLCRDIFHTGGLNEFGSGQITSSPNVYSVPQSAYVALLAGFISSIIVFLSLRGMLGNAKSNVEPHEAVQFIQVTTNDENDEHRLD